MRTHFTIQVPRSSDLDRHLKKFTAKLERLLWVFPPELVRLHGRLVHKNGREGTVCSLDLHLPTAQLNTEEAAPTAQAALHGAAEELTQQLIRHRQKLGEMRRRRAAPMPAGALAGAASLPGGAFAAAANGAAGRELGDYIGGELSRLEAFVAQRLQAWEGEGEVAAGSVDPREVLDEAVVEALSSTPREAVLNRERWFRLLAERAIRRLARANGPLQHGQTIVSLQAGLPPGPGDDGGRYAPEEVLSADTPTPETIAYTDEVIAELAAAARRLPREQRHDLLLWLIEGFTPHEVASLSQRTVDEVRASLQAARRQLGRSIADLPAPLRRRLA